VGICKVQVVGQPLAVVVAVGITVGVPVAIGEVVGVGQVILRDLGSVMPQRYRVMGEPWAMIPILSEQMLGWVPLLD